MNRNQELGILAAAMVATMLLFAPRDYAQTRSGEPLATSSSAATFEFVENRGQLYDQFQHLMPEVRYYAESHGVLTYFTKNSQHFVFSKSEKKTNLSEHDSILGADKNTTLYRADMTFLGASAAATIAGIDRREDYLNFYRPCCPNGLTNVPAYASLYYTDLYRHIDLAIHADGVGVKYEFIVHPGGNVSDIRMHYDTREQMSMAADGSLHVSNSFGEMTDPKPVSFQSDVEIESGFTCSGNTVSYHVGEYDHSRDLTIDPPRVWGTYYGGSSGDQFFSIATDPSNNIYGTGITQSGGGIATTGAFQTTYSYLDDAFLVKFSSTGARLWGTYIGGTAEDAGRAVAVDGNGDIVLTGWTETTSGIATNGAYQTTQSYPGYEDCFIMKFNNSGTRTWGTYYGTTTRDMAWGIGTDASKNIYIGGTWSGYPNLGSAFVAKFNSSGTSLIWNTTFSGTGGSGDAVYGLAVDAAGNSYATGSVSSTAGFATAGANQTAIGGSTDAFVTKLNASGVVQWSTYYGGTGYDQGNGITVDTSGSIYVAGQTGSTTNISTSGAEQTSRGTPGPNGFLSKWSGTGSLLWGTYYGAAGSDMGFSVAKDRNRNIIFSGATYSSSAIATTGEYQTSLSATPYNAFLAEFDTTGSRLWGTYYGANNEYGQSVAIDSNNYILMAGVTYDNSGALATSGAYQTNSGGSDDGFLVKFCGIETPSVASTGGASICQGTSTTLSIASGYSSYQWKLASTDISGATSNSYLVPSNLSPGTYNYSVAVTNSQGCSAISPTRTLTVNVNPTATAGTNHTICFGDSITVGGVATGGLSPYTYAWSPSVGLSNSTVASPKASPASTTTYTVTATDANGCQGTSSVVVTVNPVPTLSLTRHVETCAGTPVTIGSNASGSAAPYSYVWTPSAGLSSTSVAQPSANPASETKYFVTVTDANECHTFDSVDVVINPVPVLSTSPDVSICQGSTTQLTSSTTGGTGTLTYAWTPTAGLSSATVPNPVASPTITTNYQLTVTDAKGCTATKYITVTVNNHPVPILLPSTSIELCEGDTVMLSTQDPYESYTWSNGAVTDSTPVTQAGSYSVDVVDSHGCDGLSSTVVVRVHPRPLATIAGPDAGCPGSTAEYHTLPQSGVQYQWTLASGGTISSGATDSVCMVQWSNVGDWKLTLQVTDTTAGCTKDTSYTISVNSVLTPTLTLSGPATLCEGDSVNISAPSGYTSYKWSSGQTTSSITVNQSGAYSVQVTNASGCSGSSQAVTVQALNVPKPTPVVTAASSTICDGDSVLLTATPGYSEYIWSNGSTTTSIYAHKSGNYSVTATNSNGCQGTSPPIAITVLPSPPVSVTASGSTTICEGSSVTLTASPGFSKYQWSNGAVTPSIQAANSETYTVTVTNQNGCTRMSDSLNVTVVSIPSPVISGPVAACANSIETYSVGNIPGSTVQWRVTGGAMQSGQGTNSITIRWGAAGAGSVDADQSVISVGCQGSAPTLAVAIGTSLKPVISTTQGRTALCGIGDSLTLDAGSGYAHYTWSNGQTTEKITIGTIGSFTVSVDDGAGCSGVSDPIVIAAAQPPQPAVQSDGPLSFCEGDSVILDAGSGYASYAWSENGTLISGAVQHALTVRQSGSYMVNVTNAAGCSGISPATIVTVYSLPAQPTITESNGVLTSSPDQTYQWSLDGNPVAGETSQTISISSSGSYTVTIADANGCERESLPYTTTIQGLATISLPSIIRATPDSSISIPLIMTGAKNLTETGATTFAGMLRVQADLLTPTDPNASLVGKEWNIPISGPVPAGNTNGASDTLLLIPFTAGTVDPDCGPLSIDTFYFPNAFVNVTSEVGEVCVAGVCTSWIVALDTGFYIRSVLPNPTNGSFTIEYAIPVDGTVSLLLEDMIGRTASVLKRQWVTAGRYTETYDASSITSGTYRIELRSGSRTVNKMLEMTR